MHAEKKQLINNAVNGEISYRSRVQQILVWMIPTDCIVIIILNVYMTNS